MKATAEIVYHPCVRVLRDIQNSYYSKFILIRQRKWPSINQIEYVFESTSSPMTSYLIERTALCVNEIFDDHTQTYERINRINLFTFQWMAVTIYLILLVWIFFLFFRQHWMPTCCDVSIRFIIFDSGDIKFAWLALIRFERTIFLRCV